MQGSGFRVQGSGSRVEGSGFSVQELGVRGLGFWVSGVRVGACHGRRCVSSPVSDTDEGVSTLDGVFLTLDRVFFTCLRSQRVCSILARV